MMTDFKNCYIPHSYVEAEGGIWKSWEPKDDFIDLDLLNQCGSKGDFVALGGRKVFAIAFEDPARGVDNFWRWDVKSGHFNIPEQVLSKEKTKHVFSGSSSVRIDFPTETGQVVRILNQTFYVVAVGGKPGTIKLFGPFDWPKMSTRTVNWERFIRDRVRVI